MFKFIHAADIHLDSPLKGLARYEDAPVEEIRQATRRALENLVRLAIDQAVAFVLIAGDLYDDDGQDFKTVRFLVAKMADLRKAGIKAYLIAGNHDAANKMTRLLRLPDNVHMFSHREPETVRLEDLEVAIHGQSYAEAATVRRLARGYPPALPGAFNIGLLHTSATGREGHEPYAPCSLEELRSKGYDYWALGHVHRREVLWEDPPIVFAGNLQGRHVRETGPKGCTLVTVDDQGKPHPEPRWVDVFRWQHCRIDASEVSSGGELLDRVRQRLEQLAEDADGRPLAVRVEIEGPSKVHEAVAAEPIRWENEIRSLVHDLRAESVWIEKVKLRTSLPPDLDQIQSVDGPLAELIRYIAELKSDPDRLASLGVELAPLKERLPAELKEGPDAIGLDAPETLREALDQVEQILIRRLLSPENQTT